MDFKINTNNSFKFGNFKTFNGIADNNLNSQTYTNDFSEIDYSDTALAENNFDLNKGIVDAIISTEQEKQAELERIRQEAARKAEEERIEALRLAEEYRKKQEEERQAKLDYLEKLYNDREDNNGIFHPDKEKKIENEILKLENELGVPHRSDGWEKFVSNPVEYVAATTVTFVASVGEGILSVGEDILDGGAMLVGGVLSYGVSIFDPDKAVSMQNGIKKFVQTDLSATAYDSFVSAVGIDEDIAYGWAHNAGEFLGEAGATIALQALPGGTAVMTAAHGLKGMGDAAQKNFDKNPDATFSQVFSSSLGSGIIEASAANILYGSTHTKVKGISEPIKVTENISTLTKASKATNKLIVAGTKEYAKEATTIPLDGDYDWGSATLNAGRAVLVQVLNEASSNFIKNRIETKKANVSKASANIDKAYKKIEKQNAKIAKMTTSDAENLGNLFGNNEIEKVGLKGIDKSIEHWNQVIQDYDKIFIKNQLNLLEKGIDKIGVKWANKFIKKTIYDEAGKAVVDYIKGD